MVGKRGIWFAVESQAILQDEAIDIAKATCWEQPIALPAHRRVEQWAAPNAVVWADENAHLLDSRDPPAHQHRQIVPPSEEYKRRLAANEASVRHFEKLHGRIGGARLLLAAVGVAIAWAALYSRAIPATWLLVPVTAFIALVAYHQTVRRGRALAERTVAFYRSRLARIEERWAGTGSAGERFADPHHIYSADLDLFGKGSVFELLSAARTRMGEDTLANWLLSPAAADVVRSRHVCLQDLRHRLDLREEVAVLGTHADAGVRPDSLMAWAETPNVLTGRVARWAAWLLPALAVCSVVVWQVWGTVTPLLLFLIVQAGVLQAFKKSLRRTQQGTETAFEDLRLFANLLLRFEREAFEAEPLRRLIKRLSSHTLPASRTIGKLATVVGFIEARRSPVLALLDVPLMYSLHTSLAAERWRAQHGVAMREWVLAMGEIEALLSIAAYSYEHPDDPLPEIIDGPACFDATALGHPLIAASQCVRNDVSVCGATRLLIVSGSNMSGKSTLLRTVGINTVLAMAGAPVRAGRLRLTPLQIGASIRVNDSLHEGSSRFYAEILRLRQLLELTKGPAPLLFLLDELLQGTNSKDRRVGAEGIVKAFVERAAIGLISTHDLALTDIVGLAPDALRNVHFQDEIEAGRMKFDFRLREGVVTKRNGIELMRSVGLAV